MAQSNLSLALVAGSQAQSKDTLSAVRLCLLLPSQLPAKQAASQAGAGARQAPGSSPRKPQLLCAWLAQRWPPQLGCLALALPAELGGAKQLALGPCSWLPPSLAPASKLALGAARWPGRAATCPLPWSWGRRCSSSLSCLSQASSAPAGCSGQRLEREPPRAPARQQPSPAPEQRAGALAPAQQGRATQLGATFGGEWAGASAGGAGGGCLAAGCGGGGRLCSETARGLTLETTQRPTARDCSTAQGLTSLREPQRRAAAAAGAEEALACAGARKGAGEAGKAAEGSPAALKMITGFLVEMRAKAA